MHVMAFGYQALQLMHVMAFGHQALQLMHVMAFGYQALQLTHAPSQQVLRCAAYAPDDK